MRIFLLGSMSALAFSSMAFAQEQAVDARQSASNMQPVAAAPQSGIADIIVTASRRAENVQKAALSIQALSSEALTRANVVKPEDLGTIAAGLSIAAGGNYPQAYIRGVGTFGGNPYDESAVAFNLDGVYIARSWATRGMFFDLDRVEVLKGPQGTLYGRNASGGAINVISAKPRLGTFSGYAEGQVGNYNLFGGAAALNIPLSSNAALRVAGQIIDRDGYLSDGYNDEKSQAARVQLYWEPTDNLTILLGGNYQHTGGKGAGPVLKPQLPGDKFRGASDPAVTAIYRAEPGIGALLVAPRNDGFIDATVFALNAELNWDLGFGTFTLIPSYRDSKLQGLHYFPGFYVRDAEHDKQTSVEARLGNSGDSLKWVLGAFFFNDHQQNIDDRPLQEVLQGVTVQNAEDMQLRTRSYAVFGEATFSVTDRFRVTGGLRYTYERKRIDGIFASYNFPNQSPPPVCQSGVFDPATPYAPLFCHLSVPLVDKLTFNSVTYKAGVEFDIAPQSMAFANVSTGFKSGGYFQAPPPNTYNPEKLTAYVVGVKNRFLDNRLQINLEGFYWKYDDHQESYVGPTTIPGLYSFLTINAGRAKSYGLDVDVQFKATRNDDLNLKVQYNKSRYDSFSFNSPSAIFGPPVTGCKVGALTGGFQQVDCSGLPLMRAPLWSGTAGYAHTFDLNGNGEVRVGADIQFESSSYRSPSFLQEGRQEAYAMGNVDISYTSQDRRWMVSAFVHNVTNELVYDFLFRSPLISPANPLANRDGAITGAVRPPRTFGGRIRYSF